MRSISHNRVARLKAACSLLALALLGATSQYLAHFHVQPASAHATQQVDDSTGHGAAGHCSLCLQFDRLPAPPAPAVEPVARFFAVSVVDTATDDRTALDAPHLWPPARAPPALTC
jgi:hypothetical protein